MLAVSPANSRIELVYLQLCPGGWTDSPVGKLAAEELGSSKAVCLLNCIIPCVLPCFCKSVMIAKLFAVKQCRLL